MRRGNVLIRLALVWPLSLASGCADSNSAGVVDAAGDGRLEAEFYPDLTEMAAASDLVIQADLTDAQVSAIQLQGGAPGQLRAICELTLTVDRIFGQRPGVGADTLKPGSTVTLYWSLNDSAEADIDVARLRSQLPSTGWWLLRAIDDPRFAGGYRLVHSAAVLEDDGGVIKPSMLLASAAVAIAGGEGDATEGPLIADIVRQTPSSLVASLTAAATGPRPAGLGG